MYLIKELGLEKCKQIVDGAPEGRDTYCLDAKDYFKQLPIMKRCSVCVDLGDLRTAIADHDQQLCGQSEEKEFNSGDLVALNGELFPDFKLLYVVKQESKRFGFVVVYLSGEEIRNFHTRDVRRATEKELDLGYRVTQTPYSNTEYFNTRKIEADHCTDIRNHISPLTGVIER